MTTLFVRHAVSDYPAWRKTYDGFLPIQKANGVLSEAVYQSIDDPNDVTVTHEFATLEAAQAFTRIEEFGKGNAEGRRCRSADCLVYAEGVSQSGSRAIRRPGENAASRSRPATTQVSVRHISRPGSKRRLQRKSAGKPQLDSA